uniref:Type III potassium channel toxin protein n=1 Tax=Anemonia sulcata TaxID=6108 RepID=A0A0S1M191_ANESU|nr:type III potassium channel toxin protein [Anemonia sulcata]
MKLFIVILSMLVIAKAWPAGNTWQDTDENNDGKIVKRLSCSCDGVAGTYWFGISYCHQGSTGCPAFLGQCCIK